MCSALKEYTNLLKMVRKPSREEFVTTTKVALTVMFTVGMVGFVVYLLMDVIPKML